MEKSLISKGQKLRSSLQEKIFFSKIRTSKNTIDVRGLRVHEAEIIIERKLENFMDRYGLFMELAQEIKKRTKKLVIRFKLC